jgi:hypothetical protein
MIAWYSLLVIACGSAPVLPGPDPAAFLLAGMRCRIAVRERVSTA